MEEDKEKVLLHVSVDRGSRMLTVHSEAEDGDDVNSLVTALYGMMCSDDNSLLSLTLAALMERLMLVGKWAKPAGVTDVGGLIGKLERDINGGGAEDGRGGYFEINEKK